MIRTAYLSLLTGMLLFLTMGCDNTREDRLFIQKQPSETGLFFQNQLDERADFNILNYLYYYNGGGVGIGDFNNDGLIDLFFTRNMGENKMFLNKGRFRFNDITKEAGVTGM